MAGAMTPAKPLASLTSGLLARKGHARPAMRPQGMMALGGVQPTLDDLGWNDLGWNDPGDSQDIPVAAVPVAAAPIPPVLRQREVLREELAVPPAPMATPQPEAEPTPELESALPDAPLLPARAAAVQPRRVSANRSSRAKAAFTLRLDPDRHLRLRLASAMANRSAQQLVTDALDALLSTLPDVEDTARRLASTSSTGPQPSEKTR